MLGTLNIWVVVGVHVLDHKVRCHSAILGFLVIFSFAYWNRGITYPRAASIFLHVRFKRTNTIFVVYKLSLDYTYSNDERANNTVHSLQANLLISNISTETPKS
jgi:hypothetical protein